MKQQGFTLIELMIVVAIIGILASIAVPQYQRYIASTQVSRLYSEVSNVKSTVEYFIGNNQLSFTEKDIGWYGSSLADKIDGANPTASDGLDLLNWSTGGGYGVLKATLGESAASMVKGAVIYIEREQEGVWSCQIEKGSAGVWSSSYLPDGCALLADGAVPIDD